MIQAIRKSPFNWDLNIYENDLLVARINSAWYRRRSHMSIGDKRYLLYRQKRLSGAYVLELDGKVLGQAKKVRTWGGRYLVGYQGINYRFHTTWPYFNTWSPHRDSKFFLYLDEEHIGSIVSKKGLPGPILVDLPDKIDLAGKGFFTWLALIMWKRYSTDWLHL